MQGAAIVKAPGCPHYVLRSKFEAWHLTIGPHAASLMRCDRCLLKPVVTYGVPDRPGRHSDSPRPARRLNQREHLARRLA